MHLSHVKASDGVADQYTGSILIEFTSSTD